MKNNHFIVKKKHMFLLATIIFTLSTKPLRAAPLNSNQGAAYDQDILTAFEGSESRYQRLPFFWFRRPVNDDDNTDYAGGNDAYIGNNLRTSTYNYAAVGAGWGR